MQYYKVKEGHLKVYGWEKGDLLIILNEKGKAENSLGKIYLAYNLAKNEKRIVFEDNIEIYNFKYNLPFLYELKYDYDLVEYLESDYTEGERLFRLLTPIKINDSIIVSIQACFGCYCYPNETLYDLNKYTNMEVAIFVNHVFSSIEEILPNFSKLKYLSEYMSHNDNVYHYVPVDIIQDLINELRVTYSQVLN